MPQVFLPLGKVNKCDACGCTGKVQLCSQCAERSYCSTHCQKADWKIHKVTCKTDRIDLSSFYPVLACIAESSRMMARVTHPAILHKILNAPNPDTPATVLPDGSEARLVVLGPSENGPWNSADLNHWWSKGQSPAVRSKLFGRIAREGNVLPIVLATCVSIMLAMYTTTTRNVGSNTHRVRLRYRSSPISDFGIAAGSARVTPEDQLVYILPDKHIMKGQNPKDHYWIYFQTQKGEEVVLDCNMFTFNMCLMIYSYPYLSESMFSKMPPFVPAWFKDRTMNRSLASAPQLLTERHRYSVLRDEGIRAACEKVEMRDDGTVLVADDALNTFGRFMSKVAKRPIKEPERQYFLNTLVEGTNLILDTAVISTQWKTFPAQPQVNVEGDPGEELD